MDARRRDLGARKAARGIAWGLAAIFLAGAGLVGLAGCTSSEQETQPTPEPPSDTATPFTIQPPTSVAPSAVLPLEPMYVELAASTGRAAHTFTLDDITVMNAGGGDVAAPIAGSIALPDGDGPAPVVVIIHGVMNVTSIREPVFEGFNYLVEQLAAEGFAAISILMSLQYSIEFGEPAGSGWAWGEEIFDAHIEALAAANEGQDVGHGLDLTGRLDLANIHLIGHSRGGEVSTGLAVSQAADGRDGPIRSLLRLASTAIPNFLDEADPFFDPSNELFFWAQPDLPTAFILPEFDGDVMQDGQIVFDEILTKGENTSFAHLVFLRGANHNWFSTLSTADDRLSFVSFADESDQSTWLGPDEQRAFLTNYAVAFLQVVTGRREPWGAFDPAAPQPERLFHFDATSSLYVPGAVPLIEAPSSDAQAPATAGDATASFFQQGIPPSGGSLFNHPGVLGRQFRQLPLWGFTWGTGGDADAAGHGARAAMPVVVGNLSGHSAISLYLAVDSSNEANPAGADQALSVVLRDGSGAEQAVIVPAGTPALSRYPGRLDAGLGEEPIWLGYTPLGELRIPLALFDGINLADIVSIALDFDQTPSGALMLASALLLP